MEAIAGDVRFLGKCFGPPFDPGKKKAHPWGAIMYGRGWGGAIRVHSKFAPPPRNLRATFLPPSDPPHCIFAPLTHQPQYINM